MKKSFYEQQNALHRSQRAEDRASKAVLAKQDTKAHQGRKQASFAAPAKKQPKAATGGYTSGGRDGPFKSLKT